MLQLVNITKDYVSKNQPTVHALKGINLNFRKNEFVSILGQSGCGKTTLLNVMGGLDRASSGELVIEGKSTKDYTDRDWDTYRNHSIGFVFQSYNLIPHINVISNVEIALTVSGISKHERKKRALEALKKVGLGGLEKKKPNQLSGGQMQRVSIARALVNNPEIVLADEPTGALDSETSVQIMDLLKEISKERLVIMVTHNPELADKYSTRIVRMSDGLIIDDSNPFDGVYELEKDDSLNKGKKKQTSMSFKTAIGLSFTNLLTKKWRTFLTAFAGSIGIIGIALVLSVSYGFNCYIDNVQQDALSSYPMTISKSTVDLSSLLTGIIANIDTGKEKFPKSDVVTNNDQFSKLLSQYVGSTNENDVPGFKKYIESAEVQEKYGQYMTGIQYKYSTQFNIYPVKDDDSEPKRTYPYDLYIGDWGYIDDLWNSASAKDNEAARILANGAHTLVNSFSDLLTGTLFAPFNEMIPNLKKSATDKEYNEILDRQYDVVAGKMPASKEEVVLIVDEYNSIDDFMLYALGELNPQDLLESLLKSTFPQYEKYINPYGREKQKLKKTYNELLGLSFKLPVSYKLYNHHSNEQWIIKNGDELKAVLNDPSTLTMKVVGIVRQKEGVTSTSMSGAIGYLPSLTEYMIEQTNLTPTGYDTVDTNIVLARKKGSVTAFTYYDLPEFVQDTETKEWSKNIYWGKKVSLSALGVADLSSPNSIYIYAKDFAAKEKIQEMIKDYNKKIEVEVRKAHENDPLPEDEKEAIIKKEIEVKSIHYNDNVAVLMSSVQTIVNSVSYVLIAFVSISLIVSSIMIGIITYISVLERTKEIGILRSIGARKSDIANVFNAETLMIGLSAGLIGDAFSLILDIPIKYIIYSLTKTWINIIVPWYGLIMLPAISVLLTIIAGLIPSMLASKRDPVVALRSE